MLENQKGSKGSYDSLVSTQNLSQNIGSLDWRPGQCKFGQKMQKHSYLWRLPQVSGHGGVPRPEKFFFRS